MCMFLIAIHAEQLQQLPQLMEEYIPAAIYVQYNFF